MNYSEIRTNVKNFHEYIAKIDDVNYNYVKNLIHVIKHYTEGVLSVWI